jgi:plastocyanin
MKRLLLLLGLLLILLSGCGIVFTKPTQPGVVHMHANVFDQASITIAKGTSISLVADDGTPHDIENGSWVQGIKVPLTEVGAPHVDVANKGHDTKVIGPFNVAGTYHIYCNIHPGMNLTIVVQAPAPVPYK